MAAGVARGWTLAPRCARCPANGRTYELLRAHRERDQSTMRAEGATNVGHPPVGSHPDRLPITTLRAAKA